MPLVVFAAVFLGLCITLEAADVVLFSRVWPFVFVLLAPWLWWLHITGYSGLGPMRGTVALLTRLAVLGMFILVLAEPRAVRKDDRLSVVYAVDHSASITPDATDAALKYVLTLASGKPEKDEAGLLFFGRNAAVELPPAMSLPFEAINVQIDRDGTDVAGALSLSAAMLPRDHAGRIVLVSDGVQTQGRLAPVLDDLKSKGIAVDVLPIDYNYEKEVWLERLELPRFVKIGETYEATVILSSLQAGRGRLVLHENGQVIFDDEVTFTAGKNRYDLPIRLRQPGYYEYTAEIHTPRDHDSWTQNNRAISYLYLKGEGRVLLVVEDSSIRRDYELLEKAIRQVERDVQVMSAIDFPRDPLALLPYDAVLLVNVPRDAFDEVQIQAAHDAVYHQGIGLAMIGGEHSFGPGAWAHTPIEQALPVSMDITQRKAMPKGALAIILHTCEFPQGNTWGKRITKQAIKVLSAKDEVGVLAYDFRGGEKWLFELTPAEEYERLATLINNAEIGDMPSFANTMQMGFTGLKNSDAAAKHMIIISDGDPSPPAPALLQQFIDARISVSTIAVFPHGGTEVGTLSGIANATGGRYYFPQDPNRLPSIFIKEAKTLRRTAIQNRTFTPVMDMISPVMKGVEKMPPLHGFVLTTVKPRATVVLKSPSEEELEPVLAVWRYGVGAAAAFTSDLSTNWGKDWVQWEHYQPVIKQLLLEISRATSETDLRVRSFAAAGEGIVHVEDHAANERLMEVQAEVRMPDGQTERITLDQIGPRRYEGRFALKGQGRYQVTAVGVGANAQPQRAFGGFVVPYSQEYLRFRADPITLREVAQRTGGRLLRGTEEADVIYGEARREQQTSRPIVDWLLIALACLIPLDVGVRRVQMDWALVASWFRRTQAESEGTTNVLLERKKQVAASLKGEGARPRPALRQAPAAAPPPRMTITPQPHTEQPKPAQAASSEAATSETEGMGRLLAAKRRAREQMQQDKNKDN